MKITGSILILILALPACDSVRASQVPDDGVPSASVVDPDFSPGGPYAGPLVIPSISRFRNLPNRMDLEPLILPPDTVLKIDERLVPLFERVLQEATDAELQEVAALSLARVAEEKLADIRGTATALLQVLRSSRNERIRFACAYALAAGNVEAAAPELIQLASKRSDDQRLLIEPALARWKVQSAVDLWRPRLTDPDISDVSFRLAAEGLTALNDAASLEPLRQIVADSSADFGMRMSAAKAVAILNPDQAFAAAEQHTDGSVQDRLLAIALLDNTKTESYAPTARLCDDRSDSIAAAAWQQLYRRSPELPVLGVTYFAVDIALAELDARHELDEIWLAFIVEVGKIHEIGPREVRRSRVRICEELGTHGVIGVQYSGVGTPVLTLQFLGNFSREGAARALERLSIH